MEIKNDSDKAIVIMPGESVSVYGERSTRKAGVSRRRVLTVRGVGDSGPEAMMDAQ